MATLADVLEQAVRARHANGPPRPRAREARRRGPRVRQRRHSFLRQADRQQQRGARGRSEAREACWKLIGSVVAAAVLLIGVLLPERLWAAGRIPDSVAAPGGGSGWPPSRLRSSCRKPHCCRRRAWKNWRANSSSSIRRRRRLCIWTDAQSGSLAMNGKIGPGRNRHAGNVKSTQPRCSGSCGPCSPGSG